MTSAAASRPVAAGTAYFALVFMTGFLLGILRTLVLEPKLGATVAVLVELPVILGISWLVCRRLIIVFHVAGERSARLQMGGTALVLLLLAELGLSLFLLGNSMAEHLDNYRTTAGLVGLAGQLVFAAFPLVAERQA